MRPLLSFVIPYRGKRVEIIETVMTVLMIPSDDIECIVSDNDDESHLELADLSSRDSRLRVFRPESRLSMTDNFDFASRLARGRWHVYIGADDGVAWSRYEHFIQSLDASTTGVITGPTIDFFWPGAFGLLRSGMRLSESGSRLSWWQPTQPGQTMSQTVGLPELDGNGRSQWPPFIPKVYGAGAIRQDLVEEIRRRHGQRLFRTVTPDWFISLAASRIVSQFDVLDRGFVIQGASVHSNGLNVAAIGQSRDDVDGLAQSTESGARATLDRQTSDMTMLTISAWLAAHPEYNVGDAVLHRALDSWLINGSHNLTDDSRSRLFGVTGWRGAQERRPARRVPRFRGLDRSQHMALQLRRLLDGDAYIRCVKGPLSGVVDAGRAVQAYDKFAQSTDEEGRGKSPWAPIKRWSLDSWSGIHVGRQLNEL